MDVTVAEEEEEESSSELVDELVSLDEDPSLEEVEFEVMTCFAWLQAMSTTLSRAAAAKQALRSSKYKGRLN